MTTRNEASASLSGQPRLDRGNRRTFVALAVAAAIPVLLLSGWVATLMAQQQRDLTRGAAVASATRVAERVASDIAAQVAVLEAEAASATLDKPDLAAFYAEAERLKEGRPLWETVELAGPDGRQIVNLLRSLDDELGPTADRGSFDAVVRTRRPVVGGIGPVGAVSGKRLVALRVPVVRDGRTALRPLGRARQRRGQLDPARRRCSGRVGRDHRRRRRQHHRPNPRRGRGARPTGRRRPAGRDPARAEWLLHGFDPGRLERRGRLPHTEGHRGLVGAFRDAGRDAECPRLALVPRPGRRQRPQHRPCPGARRPRGP